MRIVNIIDDLIIKLIWWWWNLLDIKHLLDRNAQQTLTYPTKLVYFETLLGSKACISNYAIVNDLLLNSIDGLFEPPLK